MGNIPNKVPRFIAKKWIKLHDQSGKAENRYKPRKQIRFKTLMLQSDLCDYGDAYIVVKGTISVKTPNNDAYDKKLAFKNNAPFISCISDDLDIVMPMYNLSTAKIIQRHLVPYGIIAEINQIVVMITT